MRRRWTELVGAGLTGCIAFLSACSSGAPTARVSTARLAPTGVPGCLGAPVAAVNELRDTLLGKAVLVGFGDHRIQLSDPLQNGVVEILAARVTVPVRGYPSQTAIDHWA